MDIVSRGTCLTFGAAVLGATLFAPAGHAAFYEKVYGADVALSGTGSDFLDSVVVGANDITYAFGRLGGSSVQSVNGATLATSPVMVDAQWPESGDIAGFYSGRVIADAIYFTNFLTHGYYKVDISTGAVTTLASKAAFDLVANTSVGLVSTAVISPLGDAYVYERNTDNIFTSDVAGNVSVAVSAAELTSLTGTSIISGGMEIIGNYLYFGVDNASMMYRWNLVTDMGEAVFSSTSVVDNLTADVDGDIDFEDIFLGNDGWVYFFEDDSDSIMRFDPLTPDNVQVVLTEQQLLDGPSDDGVGQFGWYNNRLAWTVTGRMSDPDAGFFVIPEPASLVLLATGGLVILKRRK